MFDQLSSRSPIDLLDDAIYRWRGIAQWPETEATVYSCAWVDDRENGSGWYDVEFSYWGNGEIQKGSFRNLGRETASPYFRRDTFTLRYNPKRPSSFYYANERSNLSSLPLILLFVVIGTLAGLIVIGLLG